MVIHTNFYKGKRVQVILNDGTSFVDKFVEKRSKGIVLAEKGFVYTRDIRSSTIYKGPADKEY